MTTNNISASITHRQYEGKGCKGITPRASRSARRHPCLIPKMGATTDTRKRSVAARLVLRQAPTGSPGRSAGLPGKPYAR
jgi:hypothetical protein